MTHDNDIIHYNLGIDNIRNGIYFAKDCIMGCYNTAINTQKTSTRNQQKERTMTDKKYIDLDVITELMGELPDRVIAQAKTLDEHQVAEIEAMRGYIDHQLQSETDEDSFKDLVVKNEFDDAYEDFTFPNEEASNEAWGGIAETIRIESVGAYFVAINKNA